MTVFIKIPYYAGLGIVPDESNSYKFSTVSYPVEDSVSVIVGSILVETIEEDDVLKLITAESGEEEQESFIGGVPITCVRIGSKWYVKKAYGASDEMLEFSYMGYTFRSKRIGSKWYIISD